MREPIPAKNRPLREASVHGRIFARVGLLGNPSDTNPGKAIAARYRDVGFEASFPGAFAAAPPTGVATR